MLCFTISLIGEVIAIERIAPKIVNCQAAKTSDIKFDIANGPINDSKFIAFTQIKLNENELVYSEIAKKLEAAVKKVGGTKITIISEWVETETISDKYDIMIRDIHGQILKYSEIKNKEKSIDVSDLSNGIYIISIYSKNNIITKKFIKL